MDTSSSSLLTISSRFIPYDQWLITHVDPAWKVKQVKLWILAKCIAHPHRPLDIHIDAPKKPKTKHRPASPIVFAQDPEFRPISPITFASNSTIKTVYDSSEPSSEQEIGQGYEEDNEDDSDDPDIRGRGRPPYFPGSTVPVPSNRATAKTSIHLPDAPAESSLAGYNVPAAYEPHKLTLLRFATGQILEDDQRLDMYDIKPYELFEVHRAGVILRLPRNVISEYVQPYWEGWVKSLRQVFMDPPKSTRGDNSSTKKHPNNKPPNRRRTWRLEWRDRWMIVKDGMLALYKDREDGNTSQLLPLSALCSLRGVEHLNRTTRFLPKASQRIVCARFSTRTNAYKPENYALGHSEAPAVPQLESTFSSSPSQPRSRSRLNEVQTFEDPRVRNLNANISEIPEANPSSSKLRPKVKLSIKPPRSNLHEQMSALSLNALEESKLTRKKSRGKKDSKLTRRGSLRAVSPLDHDEDEEYDHGIGSAADDEDGDISEAHRNDDTGPTSPVSPPIHPDEAAAAAPEGLNSYYPTGTMSFDSDSSAFSSPVFAHSNPWGDGSEVDSDVDGTKSKPGYNYYGYGYGSRVLKKDGSKGKSPTQAEMKQGGEADEDYVHVHGDVPSEQVHHTRSFSGGGFASAAASTAGKKSAKGKGREAGEWVVLDLPDDNAYTSILRILHRHFPDPSSSSFIAALPALNTPTPTTAKFPAPQTALDSSAVPSEEDPAPDNEADNVISQESTSLHEHPSSLSPNYQLNRLPAIFTGGHTPRSSISHYPTSLPRTHPHSNTDTFGALHYPEWRTEVTERAQKAALGESGRAIECFTFGYVLMDIHAGLQHFGSAYFPHSPASSRKSDKKKRPIEPEELGMSLQDRRERRRTWRRESYQSSASSITEQGDNVSTVPTLVTKEDSMHADSDSGEESSEAEWLGWMGDLHRQVKVRKEREQQKLELLAQEALGPLDGLDTQDPTPEYPRSQAEDHRRFLRERMALEPSAVVTSNVPLDDQVSPASSYNATRSSPGQLALSSPSSIESLVHRNRTVSFGFSPVDPPSSSTSTTQSHSRSESQSQYSLASVVLKESDVSSDSTVFSRRPSMPTMSPTSNIFQTQSASSSAVITAEQWTTTTVTHSSNTMPRRASSSGLGGSFSGGSIGRSVRNGPSLLRKKGSEAEAKPKGSKGKEKERDKSDSRERDDRGFRRPRMSLSASRPSLHHHSSNISSGTSNLGPTRSSSPVSRMVFGDEDVAEPSGRKKRSLVRDVSMRAEKLVRSLDPVR